jgi:uncharacterized protein YggT (Ycf19 family)
MAICSVQSMVRAMELGHMQLGGGKLCGASVSLPARASLRASRPIHMALLQESSCGEGRFDDRNECTGMSNFGYILQKDSKIKPAEVPSVNDSLLRAGLWIACPALGLGMVDSNALAAADLGPSSSVSAAEVLLPYVSFLADLDPGTAQLLTNIAGPVINIFNILFIFRIIMSWYPGIPVEKFPFFLAYNPTEPILGPTRRLIPPVGGVDVAPVIWVALMSFANEILLGKQGLLVLLSQQQP